MTFKAELILCLITKKVHTSAIPNNTHIHTYNNDKWQTMNTFPAHPFHKTRQYPFLMNTWTE